LLIKIYINYKQQSSPNSQPYFCLSQNFLIAEQHKLIH
jgi:hypothetical protein